MTVVTMSGKNQVVVPKEVRRELGLRPGDQLVFDIQDGEVLVLRRPNSYTEFGIGLGKHVWKGVDATDFVRKERSTWERRGKR